MNIRGFLDHSWLMRLVIAMWVVSSIFVMLLLNRIDGIVHGTLYNYGLQFNFEWATPFWSFERFIYICLGAPLFSSGIAIIYDFWITRKRDARVPQIVTKTNNGKVKPLKENTMVISCPKCKKVFGKPLNMLDFSGGKTRLVNVCPYCNYILGDAQQCDTDDIEVKDFGEKVTQ